MPKVIGDARKKIVIAAKRLMLTGGYAGLTVRAVARECSIATGTVYNYFEDKEQLAAQVMLEDWMNTLERMSDDCECAQSFSDGIVAIYSALVGFYEAYEPVWSEYNMHSGSQPFFKSRHTQLVSQIAAILHTHCVRFYREYDGFTDTFAAEGILVASGARHPIDGLTAVMDRIYRIDKE